MTKLLLCLLSSLSLLAACSSETNTPGSVPAAPVLPPTIVKPVVLATAEDEAPAAPTPDDIPAVVQAFRTAIDSKDISRISPLLMDPVFVSQDGDEAEGQSLARDQIGGWLNERWRGKPVFAGEDYVRDSGLLVLTTTGWGAGGPIVQGTVLFHLHRYDADGTMNDAGGAWKIDTILYR